jgi:hypothetical protein
MRSRNESKEGIRTDIPETNPDINSWPCHRLEVGMPAMSSPLSLLDQLCRPQDDVSAEKCPNAVDERWRKGYPRAGRVELVKPFHPGSSRSRTLRITKNSRALHCRQKRKWLKEPLLLEPSADLVHVGFDQQILGDVADAWSDPESVNALRLNRSKHAFNVK